MHCCSFELASITDFKGVIVCTSICFLSLTRERKNLIYLFLFLKLGEIFIGLGTFLFLFVKVKTNHLIIRLHFYLEFMVEKILIMNAKNLLCSYCYILCCVVTKLLKVLKSFILGCKKRISIHGLINDV